MKLLLLHLSDLHLTGPTDSLLARREAIVSAVQNLDYTLDAAVIVLSGDIAYSGSEEQYLTSWEFLESIRHDLADRARQQGADRLPVQFVVVPGNHDCDLSDPPDVRLRLAQSVLQQPTQAKDSSVVETCVRVQATFFQFRDAIGGAGLKPTSTGYDRRLAYEYHFTFGSETIRFLCFNTSWLSQKRELPGTLYFPPDAVPAAVHGAALVVALFHHPYNWLEPNCARLFRKHVERAADLILTGHEHDTTRRRQEAGGGERNTYVEGAALQDSDDSSASAFNVFVLDTSTKKQKFAHPSWDGTRYTLTEPSVEGEDGAGLAWEDYQVNRLRQRGCFELNDQTRRLLMDPGLAAR